MIIINVGSDRDYDRRASRGKAGSKRSLIEERKKERLEAIKALDKAGKMTRAAASRIQSHSDRTGRNEDFKERAMSAAARNEEED